jgi:hypothetical protein
MRMESELVVSSLGRKVLDIASQQAERFRANPATVQPTLARCVFKVWNPDGPESAEGTITECLQQGAPLATAGILAALALHVGEEFSDGIISVRRLEDRED